MKHGLKCQINLTKFDQKDVVHVFRKMKH